MIVRQFPRDEETGQMEFLNALLTDVASLYVMVIGVTTLVICCGGFLSK